MIYLLSQKVFQGAKNLPCIMIAYKEMEIDLAGYEALIFSSKNGVYALNHISDAWRDIPAYAIGAGTASTIESLGGRLAYRAQNSYGDEFALEIKAMLKGKKALFLRPLEVTSSLNRILKDAGVLLQEQVIYETKCAPCATLTKPESGSIIIFSSPSTIRCFFNCFDWDKGYQAVVIGDVTASYMPENVPFRKAEKQTIPSCIELAKRLSKKPL